MAFKVVRAGCPKGAYSLAVSLSASWRAVTGTPDHKTTLVVPSEALRRGALVAAYQTSIPLVALEERRVQLNLLLKLCPPVLKALERYHVTARPA